MTSKHFIDGSVIIATHGGAHRLQLTLEALERQFTKRSWEVVIVVDGIVDETLTMLNAWRDRLPLLIVVFEENRGVVAALNAGYGAARGRVLIRCDDDLTPRSDFVDRHIAWHDDGAARGVIGLTRNVFPPTPYALAYGWAADAKARAEAYASTDSSRWRHWAANNSVERSTWDITGGFDPAFRYGQDSELGWRIAATGAELVIDPDLETEHRGPATTAAIRLPRAFVSGASRRLFYEIHPDAAISSDTPIAMNVRIKLWNYLVDEIAARATSREDYVRIGQTIDKILPWIPPIFGGKLVAMGLEAGGKSGVIHGPRKLDNFQTQKHLERLAERHLSNENG